MSALGHEQTSRHVRVMSVIPLKADIDQRGLHVRFVPVADINLLGGWPVTLVWPNSEAIRLVYGLGGSGKGPPTVEKPNSVQTCQ